MGGFVNKVLIPVLSVGAGIAGTAVGGPAGAALGALPAALAIGQGIAKKNPFQIVTGGLSAIPGIGAAGSAASGAASLGANIGTTLGSNAAKIGSNLAGIGANIGTTLGQVGNKTNTLSNVLNGAGALLNTGLGIYGSLKGNNSGVRPFALEGANLNLGPAGGSSSPALPNIPQIQQQNPGSIGEYKTLVPDSNRSLLELLGAFRT